MTIKFLGHAAFLITTAGGTKIVTDPYEPGGFGGAIGYGPLREPAHIVVVSHDHADHNYVRMVPGDPVVVKGAEEQTHRDVTFRAVATFHDHTRGSERGRNTIWLIEADGLTLCHLGDLGQSLSTQEVSALGHVDVLMVPVGGVFTIDAKGAAQFISRLRPHIAIPMHYKTPKVGFEIDPVDTFLAGKPNLRLIDGSEVEITRDTLPEPTEIIVLKSAL